MKNRTTKLVAALSLAFTVAGGGSAFAASAPTPTPTQTSTKAPVVTPSESPTATSTSTVPEPKIGDIGADQMDALTGRYGSLSTALVNYYAVNQGQTLDTFVKGNTQQVASLLGTSDPTKLLAGGVSTRNLDSMNASLRQQGTLLDTSSYTSLEQYANDVASRSGTADAAVVSAGAKWAQQMGQLKAPSLSMPNAPGVDKSLATKMPSEGLVFGLFLDKSLTAMVTDFPDVFKQVQSGGLGTPEAQKAWTTSMMNAMKSSKTDFSGMMPSACGTTLLSVMGSGSAKGDKGGCGGCVAAGLYLNSQMQRLFDPNLNTTQNNPTDSVMPPNEYNQLQGWQKQLVQQQNSSLSSQLTQSVTDKDKATGSCSASSEATTGAVKSTLPGVLGNLSKKK